jgi:membrane carboxypeptidase/penicillin-binding protein
MIDVTGVQGAAPIWHEAMLVAEAGRPIRDFADPGGLERANVTYSDGVTSTDLFMPGTVPNGADSPILFPTNNNNNNNNNDNNDNNQHRVSAHPYCSGSFSFAFPPPSGNARSSYSSWW